MEVKIEDAPAATTPPPPPPPPMTTEPPFMKKENSAYDTLRESKAGVEDIIRKMLSLKKQPLTNNPKSELGELSTQMFLHFVSLRKANRMILLEEDRVKAETDRAKAPVDSTTLQLHNLMYEKSHYLKAINACRDFKSKYPDIHLVSEEEFFREAPEEFKGIGTTDSHNLMLKRLNYELFQRKELCKLREKLEQKKKTLSETIASRKKFLSSLPSHLKALKKASLPAQNHLGHLHTKKLKQLNAAELLPPPLYIIYSQFVAQKEAFAENIELEITGSLKDAQVFVRRQTSITSIPESARIEDDVPDEEDDGQRRRKRPKKVVGKDNIEAAGIYEAHPLRIFVHIYDDEDTNPKPAKLVTLKFEYLFKLSVVCVGIEGSDEGPENNILCNLFPDDSGLEFPQQAAKLMLGNEATFDERQTLRPYKWAQYLAGIDFLPEVSPLMSGDGASRSENGKDAVVSGLSLYRQQHRVQTVVQRVRSRKKAQLALAEQLDLLANCKWPPLSFRSVPWALHKHLCCLHRWSPVASSSEQAVSLPRADMELGLVSGDANMAGGAVSKEVVGTVTEDGELPSLVQTAVVAIEDGSTSNLSEEPGLDHSKCLTLISKSVAPSPRTAGRHTFFRYEDETDLMLDSDSEVDDSTKIERYVERPAIEGKSWIDYGTQEFYLVLTRSKDVEDGNVELEAKIKLSVEYPLRPPFFKLRLLSQSPGRDSSALDQSEWYNELRAVEAEVNLHILKMLPPDHEDYVLSHQMHCLAMLFDLYLNEDPQPSERGKSNSVIDVGLCKPVSGGLTTRSFRGRDRRKMISWKDMECTPGYPL